MEERDIFRLNHWHASMDRVSRVRRHLQHFSNNTHVEEEIEEAVEAITDQESGPSTVRSPLTEQIAARSASREEQRNITGLLATVL